MKMETINLSNLPEHWRKLAQKETEEQKEIPKSNDPLVDGSGMTVNPEIKHRRKRIVSQQNYKTKRPHIAEFINACKFLTGETSKIFPLSMQHQNILSLVRNNREIPEHYQSVINHNIELVRKAAQLKPKDIKEKYYEHTVSIKEKETKQMPKGQFRRQIHTLSIDGVIIKTKARVDQTKKCAEEFINWLVTIENSMPAIIEEPKNYIAQIKAFMRDKNSSILLPVIKQILEQKQWVVENYDIVKSGKKQILALTEVAVPGNFIKTKIEDTNVEPAKPVETCNIKEVTMTPVALSEKTALSILQQSQSTTTVNDTLSMIIMLAKKAGATELVIKL